MKSKSNTPKKTKSPGKSPRKASEDASLKSSRKASDIAKVTPSKPAKVQKLKSSISSYRFFHF